MAVPRYVVHPCGCTSLRGPLPLRGALSRGRWPLPGARLRRWGGASAAWPLFGLAAAGGRRGQAPDAPPAVPPAAFLRSAARGWLVGGVRFAGVGVVGVADPYGAGLAARMLRMTSLLSGPTRPA